MTSQLLLAALLSVGFTHLSVYVAHTCTEGGLGYRNGGCT